MARINGDRLMADLRELASICAYRTGVDRVALSVAAQRGQKPGLGVDDDEK